MRRENMGGSNPGRRAARRGPGVPGAEGPSRRIPHASRSAARSASPSGTGEEGRPGGRGIKRFSGAEKGRIATGNQPGKKVVRREAPSEKRAFRRATLGEERARASKRTMERKPSHTSGKKLVLRGEKRPTRSQLLRELGHTTERQEKLHTPLKEELIRLNRFISNAGVCSRREADKFIAAGVVKVNGQIVTELGTKVSPTDEVRFDDQLITPERKVYVLLNKPKDVVTTTDDPHAEHTVMELVKGACEERIYPVGRLDRNTTGLLLLTNDGELSKKLTHPSHKVSKVYQVTLDKSVSVADIKTIANGIELDDGFIAADGITFVEGQDKDTVGIEIHSGRHRIVRRIFEALGYRVRALDRVSFAGLTKKNLPRGKWRLLSPREVSYLKMK